MPEGQAHVAMVARQARPCVSTKAARARANQLTSAEHARFTLMT
jgi:hypothetical protein